MFNLQAAMFTAFGTDSRYDICLMILGRVEEKRRMGLLGFMRTIYLFGKEQKACDRVIFLHSLFHWGF